MKNDVVTTIETITADRARAYLQLNAEKNRKIRTTVVNNLAGILARGEWKLTHQGIAFDTDGNLIDGQHRLLAIAASGITAKMCVTRGLAFDVFSAMDLGAKRSIGDIVNLDKGLIEVIRLAIEFHLKCIPSYITAPLVTEYKDIFMDEAELLAEYVKQRKKVITSASMRLAALYLIKRDYDFDYIAGQMRAMCATNFDEMSPCSRVFVALSLANNLGIVGQLGNISRRKMMFIYGTVVLNPENREKRTIRIYPKTVDRTIDDFKAFIDAELLKLKRTR